MTGMMKEGLGRGGGEQEIWMFADVFVVGGVGVVRSAGKI